jgi:hypothetical protein
MLFVSFHLNIQSREMKNYGYCLSEMLLFIVMIRYASRLLPKESAAKK